MTHSEMTDADVIVVGSGIGGLTAAGLLARYGHNVIVCESHTVAGGAAHEFRRGGYRFDSGPSFFCGLSDRGSRNPLRLVLAALGESITTIPYDPLGYYHLPEGTLPIYGNLDRYCEAIARFTPQGSQEFSALADKLMPMYDALTGIPLLELRSDWRLFLQLLTRYPRQLAKLLPQLPLLAASAGQVMDQTMGDAFVRRLFDIECFLLSGMQAHDTVAPEMAFMFGERTASIVDYPKGGSGALVAALVRGLERWGGKLRLGTHVERIQVHNNRVTGVCLQNGEQLRAPIVISNATRWNTVQDLLAPKALPKTYRQTALQTPTVDSFMHLHLGIRAEGLENLAVHHVVLNDGARDITAPGNTCMISIPSVLDPNLAPPGRHVIHAYTLEPFAGWQRDHQYNRRKQERVGPLYKALQRVIPDVRSRVELELIGTPLTHQRFLRRYQGTYGPAIAAGRGAFPGNSTPVAGLYCVGDSTRPGIGVPAAAASGILCANGLVPPKHVTALVNALS